MQTSAKKHPRLTVAEFFAGIGLMRIGLDQAGWTTVFANDIDEKKWEMYRDQFGDTGEFQIGDIHTLDAERVPSVALATASFPCNDLSLAGARKGLGGNDFQDALFALNDIGYSVDAFIVDAAKFVPQSRQRLFVVGTRGTKACVLSETPKFYQSDCRPSALADFILWHPDIDWKIRPLPPFPERQLTLEDVLQDLSPNSKHWWNQKRADYLLNQMSVKHRRAAEEMITGDCIRFGTVFRRVRNGRSMGELRTDGIAGCLRTPRGGSGRQILFVAGRGSYAVRLLTPRECARLMGADEFVVRVPINQALFGFGDGVCVPVIRWIAENYLNRVWQEEFSPVLKPKGVNGPVSYAKARDS